MVRCRALGFGCGLTALVLMAGGHRSRAASIGGGITLTGNVATDFSATKPNVRVTNVLANPQDLGESSFIPANGWVSGWAIKDIRTYYNPTTDTLYVGLDTFKNARGATAIVGDSDGNGDPGVASAPMQAAGGVDDPHLGGFKSIAIAFAPGASGSSKTPGTPTIIAGVPANKLEAGGGTDGFTVSRYLKNSLGLSGSFGLSLGKAAGGLAFDPSASHPGFEFGIKNFSKVAGINPAKGFWISAYAGSPTSVVAGVTSLPPTYVGPFQAVNTPEPASWMGWSSLTAVGLVAAIRSRDRKVKAGP